MYVIEESAYSLINFPIVAGGALPDGNWGESLSCWGTLMWHPFPRRFSWAPSWISFQNEVKTFKKFFQAFKPSFKNRVCLCGLFFVLILRSQEALMWLGHNTIDSINQSDFLKSDLHPP